MYSTEVLQSGSIRQHSVKQHALPIPTASPGLYVSHLAVAMVLAISKDRAIAILMQALKIDTS